MLQQLNIPHCMGLDYFTEENKNKISIFHISRRGEEVKRLRYSFLRHFKLQIIAPRGQFSYTGIFEQIQANRRCFYITQMVTLKSTNFIIQTLSRPESLSYIFLTENLECYGPLKDTINCLILNLKAIIQLAPSCIYRDNYSSQQSCARPGADRIPFRHFAYVKIGVLRV